MNPMASTRLYLSNRSMALWIPALILAATSLVIVVVALIVGIQVGLPLPENVQAGFNTNMGAVWALSGFLVSIGATAVNRNFAMALAFGSTRRNFWLGTSVGFVITSLVVALSSVVLLGLEVLTGGWFIGAHTFAVVYLGSGNMLVCFAASFALGMLWLFVGALFGTVYRAFGPAKVMMLAAAIGVLALGAVAGAVASWQTVLEVFMVLGAWVTVVLAVVMGIAAAAGSYAANRMATI